MSGDNAVQCFSRFLVTGSDQVGDGASMRQVSDRAVDTGQLRGLDVVLPVGIFDRAGTEVAHADITTWVIPSV